MANVGVKAAAQVADVLKVVLADTYCLYLKTQNFHWNVVGPSFSMLHALFEEQYSSLAEAVDEIAERIRSLGQASPGSFKAFSELKTLEEAQTGLDAMGMLSALSADHQALIASLNQAITTASDCKDEATADMLIQRLAYHQKQVWMIESHLA